YITFDIFSSFFFQAEDGIRDRNVTGVQTCALPIFLPEGRVVSCRWRDCRVCCVRRGIVDVPTRSRDRVIATAGALTLKVDADLKIGRASCRERVEIGGVAG